MRKFRWSIALVGVWLGAAFGSPGAAKPPDLPTQNDIRCPEAREQGEHDRLRLEWNHEAEELRLRIEARDDTAESVVPLCLDVWCPDVMPWLVQRICARMLALQQATTVEDRSRPEPAARTDREENVVYPDFAATAEQARHLYEMAGRCAREGNLEQACTCLRQAHLANPTCRFGRLAMQRLQELEAAEQCEEPTRPVPPRSRSTRPATTEEPPLWEEPQSDEDEAARSERSFRRVRETTQPLGLVPMITY